MDDPYSVLGLSSNATKEEVRARYKDLAIANHPDKQHNLSEKEKAEKEEYFKRVTLAYHMIMERANTPNNTSDGTTGASYWKEIWKRVSKRDVWETFVDVAHKYIRRKSHKVNVTVSLEEIRTRRRKKIQLFLKGIPEPVRFEIDCADYPAVAYDFEVSSDGSYHHVDIALVAKEHDTYDIDEDGNLYTFVRVSWSEYIDGVVKILRFIDKTKVSVTIPAFADLDERIVVTGYGINKECDLFVNVEISGCSRERWSAVPPPERSDILRCLEKIC